MIWYDRHDPDQSVNTNIVMFLLSISNASMFESFTFCSIESIRNINIETLNVQHRNNNPTGGLDRRQKLDWITNIFYFLIKKSLHNDSD